MQTDAYINEDLTVVEAKAPKTWDLQVGAAHPLCSTG